MTMRCFCGKAIQDCTMIKMTPDGTLWATMLVCPECGRTYLGANSKELANKILKRVRMDGTYYCFVEGKNCPAVAHTDYASAVAEASRLAKKEGKSVCVFKLACTVKVVPTIKLEQIDD